jgi:transposase
MIYRTTEQNITADFIIKSLEQLSMSITKPTVIVLDNARIHTARKVKERLRKWQNRELYIFYLPPYSPHLNIAERLWRELKSRWIKPADYCSTENLFYTVNLALAAVGKQLFINFSKFTV